MMDKSLYSKDVLEVAPALVGAELVRTLPDGREKRLLITQTEAYAGAADTACHASKGRTKRSETLDHAGGTIYVYLCYGMYWMLNVVAGTENNAQAVLICGIDEIKGSGRVGRQLKIDKSFYGEDLEISERIWIEDSDENPDFNAKPRVGVDYAGEWKDKLWRFEVTK